MMYALVVVFLLFFLIFFVLLSLVIAVICGVWLQKRGINAWCALLTRGIFVLYICTVIRRC